MGYHAHSVRRPPLGMLNRAASSPSRNALTPRQPSAPSCLGIGLVAGFGGFGSGSGSGSQGLRVRVTRPSRRNRGHPPPAAARSAGRTCERVGAQVRRLGRATGGLAGGAALDKREHPGPWLWLWQGGQWGAAAAVSTRLRVRLVARRPLLQERVGAHAGWRRRARGRGLGVRVHGAHQEQQRAPTGRAEHCPSRLGRRAGGEAQILKMGLQIVAYTRGYYPSPNAARTLAPTPLLTRTVSE